MKNNIQIIPAILATSDAVFSQMAHKISASEELQNGWVQIDLMDNKFVHNQSIGINTLIDYPLLMKKEAHLMVENPIGWVESLAKLDFSRIVFPVESDRVSQIIDKIHDLGKEVGLAINPTTPVAKINPFVDRIETALLLTVEPGCQQQQMLPTSFARIADLVKVRSNRHFLIEIDGGVSPENALPLINAGADILIVGSHLIDGDISENLEQFWEKING
ncbi:hypothetical protein M1563_00210 [Patescibacteria group bacterium]|nr:hypothetical protein [Patescibacteria group bacterium]